MATRKSNYGINENVGDSTSQYRGELPVSDSDFFRRYLCDNDSITEGYIAESYMGGYVYQVTTTSGTNYAVCLADILGGLSGTSSITIKSTRTRVLVFMTKSGPWIILGCLPEIMPNDGSLYETEYGEKDYFTEEQHNHLGNQDGIGQWIDMYITDRPMDVFPGEWGKINELGNVIALLRGFALLKATELAQVQVHTIDDLVRIVSKTFEHVSSVGEDVILDDHGRVSREMSISSSAPESLGYSTNTDITREDDERLMQPKEYLNPKDRLRVHVGYTGDLLRIYVLKPTGEAVGEIYFGKNGELVCKSAQSIELQKVKSIPTPNRKKRYNETVDFVDSTAKPFSPTQGSGEAQESDRDEWNKTYNYKSYNEESWDVKEEEPTSEGEEQYQRTEAKLHLRNDGSFYIGDTAGSFIDTDAIGNMTISCMGNLHIRTGEDTVVLAGGNSTIRAKNNLDVCCTEGDIRMKAENAFQVYSKTKGILLETDSTGIPVAGANEAHHYSGIKLKSNNVSPITIDAGQNVNIYAMNSVIASATTGEARLEGLIKATLSGAQIDLTGYPATAPLPVFNINATEINFLATDIKAKCANLFHVGADTVKISGASDTVIHGGGPNGTIVNHVHNASLDVFSYEPDGSPGGTRVQQIVKSNSDEQPTVTIVPGLPTITLMTPYIKTLIDLTMFSFRSEVFQEYLYESSWQRGYGSQSWNLSADVFQGASPFPGAGYNKYKAYNPTNGAVNTGGSFSSKSISEYKI